MGRTCAALLIACAAAVGAAQAAMAPQRLADLGVQGRDAASGEPSAIVVLIHGYGSNGLDFAPMAERLSARLPNAVFLYPNAPTPMDTGGGRPGYTWFEFAGRQAQSSRREARDWLLAEIDRVGAALGIADAPLVLAGFSQGGGMAVHVGTCAPERAALTISMGGVVDAWCDPQEGAEPEPILMVHNTGDPRVPLDWGEKARDGLRAAGYAPRFETYRGDVHWPVPAAVRDVETAIVRAVRDAERSR